MIKFSDRADIGATKKTKEGYMLATARVARTGVQLYSAGQLGDAAAHLPADAVVRVYRSPEEVFHPDSLQSLTRVPVTIGHPDVLVTADNWSEYSVGDVGDRFSRDGDWLVVNPMLKDAAGVEAATTTHKEISMGYTAEIVVARDGVDADFEQINIRHNHLAAVPRGRAGSQARFGDAAEWGATPLTVKDENMTVELKTVVMGDSQFEVVAKDHDTVTAILKDHKAAIDAKDAEIGALTVKLQAAEDKILSDEQIDAMIAARTKAASERAAVKALIGDKADAMSDAAIEGAFIALDAGADNTMRDAIEGKKPVVSNDQAAYIQMVERIKNAHKGVK